MKTALLLTTALAAVAPFMSDVLPTMEIVGQDGKPLRINVSDFDAGKHKAVNPEDAPAPAAPAAPTTDNSAPPPVPPSNTPPVTTPPAPPATPTKETAFVTENKGKFFVTDKAGKPLDANHPGYATEKEAKDAIAASAKA